eukprot:366263-Chlamydomonas_euryale.AAC.3
MNVQKAAQAICGELPMAKGVRNFGKSLMAMYGCAVIYKQTMLDLGDPKLVLCLCDVSKEVSAVIHVDNIADVELFIRKMPVSGLSKDLCDCDAVTVDLQLMGFIPAGVDCDAVTVDLQVMGFIPAGVDCDAVTVNLQLMGFIPAGVDVRASGLVQPLGSIMSSLVSSGGARTLEIDQLTRVLLALGERWVWMVWGVWGGTGRRMHG